MAIKRVVDITTGLVEDISLTTDEILAMTPSIGAAKTSKISELALHYTDAKEASVAYMNTTFQADPVSVSRLIQAVVVYTAQGAVPGGFWWKDASNNQVVMDLVQLQGLLAVIQDQSWSAYQQLTSRKDAVNAAKTVADVDLVNW